MVADIDNKLFKNICALVVDRSRCLETARAFLLKKNE